jgi:hypothetical protein
VSHGQFGWSGVRVHAVWRRWTAELVHRHTDLMALCSELVHFGVPLEIGLYREASTTGWLLAYERSLAGVCDVSSFVDQS